MVMFYFRKVFTNDKGETDRRKIGADSHGLDRHKSARMKESKTIDGKNYMNWEEIAW